MVIDMKGNILAQFSTAGFLDCLLSKLAVTLLRKAICIYEKIVCMFYDWTTEQKTQGNCGEPGIEASRIFILFGRNFVFLNKRGGELQLGSLSITSVTRARIA